MNRRSFLKNSIGALLFGALSSNKVLASIVDCTPDNSLKVLLYAIQTKNGDWKIKATKWVNLKKESLRYKDYNIETFKPLGLFDNSKIKEYQKRYAKKYNAVRSLHSVNHIQCSINGKNHCVSKQATFFSRSRGGFTSIKTGHIQALGKQWGPINALKGGTTQEIRLMGAKAMKEKSSMKITQLDLNGNLIKEWDSMNDAKRAGYHAPTISRCCNNKPKFKTHKGFIWKFK
jgi:hypothetical protein